MIEFQSVSKKYPSGQTALDGISLKIESGEFVFIVGLSGAGKSTMIKMLTRELSPSSGKVLFNNEDINAFKKSRIPLLRRRIGTVFQDFKLLLTRTVFENVAVPLEVLSKSEAEIEKEVSSALEKVGILDKANSFPSQLAGGEVQRTAIARAIISKPEVILADEPTGDLDPKNSLSVVGLLEKINKEDKTTIIMATHNSQIVNHFKKRVVVLEKGKMVKDQKEGRYEAG
ncbi:cell division ATP-binding protein FtsE [Candidatus Curtissbacteria bacterium RIFCSPLOWO2_01_FULL_39_62]|uniref:Cell division ATP-binding protein FtsE n=1 Tax=Candidatus Curtissbacteria bacterium RIFCSPHIGHO2_02_FULL_40_16b TaxID=1797714 RepID=A0A1F5GBX7_9BACT|nr:MAG: cell division ATP-binding protein FtsE [Candidatus Curtissbacteria bacterium RIFCSPHIGHO2_01_FULL_39_57]OGD89356.1 MAG: cell division ATP-binding protein FtsE [Candidatus Curtissbacteria bacterium RIFCSPHIGHO2_02_FULL_40_16b]OGD90747.1 MAG: cell division ATP-binding protein FtsE [Candidatus Curtissbacteria bacterium RIFCSPHIGHO2_12_FULL_38_37]OGE01043.1 MAG: cell division ATP-binding protein FtsE [Candidatus Curtissbacteria bacterium RIFCSPLOWO2_02_FULL_40_11]OGE02725.1 MAG: cell divisi